MQNGDYLDLGLYLPPQILKHISETTKPESRYSFLMRYYVKQKTHKTAYDYAKKLQELQPEDAEIRKVVEALAKAAN